jgi:hypothetical protein
MRSNDSLMPACLKDECVDRFRCLQLVPSRHKIPGRPKLTRYVLPFKAREMIKDFLRGMLPDDPHELGWIRIERHNHDPLKISGTNHNGIQPPAIGDTDLLHPFHQIFGDIANQVMIAETRNQQAGKGQLGGLNNRICLRKLFSKRRC